MLYDPKIFVIGHMIKGYCVFGGVSIQFTLHEFETDVRFAIEFFLSVIYNILNLERNKF